MNIIQIKHGNTVPTKEQLAPYELGFQENGGGLFINDGGTIYKIGSSGGNVDPGGGGGGEFTGEAVLYTKQDLTDDQKAQARENIGVEDSIIKELMSLQILTPFGEGNSVLGEEDTILVSLNGDIFLPDVLEDDEESILRVKNGRWTKSKETSSIPQPKEGALIGQILVVTAVNEEGKISETTAKNIEDLFIEAESVGF